MEREEFRDLLPQILLQLDIREILERCSTSKQFNQVCNSEAFWKQYLEEYYGVTEQLQGQSFKETVLHYYQVQTFIWKKLKAFITPFALHLLVTKLWDNYITVEDGVSQIRKYSNVEEIKIIDFKMVTNILELFDEDDILPQSQELVDKVIKLVQNRNRSALRKVLEDYIEQEQEYFYSDQDLITLPYNIDEFNSLLHIVGNSIDNEDNAFLTDMLYEILSVAEHDIALDVERIIRRRN